jgi:hypothetical protein
MYIYIPRFYLHCYMTIRCGVQAETVLCYYTSFLPSLTSVLRPGIVSDLLSIRVSKFGGLAGIRQLRPFRPLNFTALYGSLSVTQSFLQGQFSDLM